MRAADVPVPDAVHHPPEVRVCDSLPWLSTHATCFVFMHTVFSLWVLNFGQYGIFLYITVTCLFVSWYVGDISIVMYVAIIPIVHDYYPFF